MAPSFRTGQILATLLAGFTLAALQARAVDLSLEGPKLVVGGVLDVAGAAAFAARLDAGQVRTVAFDDAYGGTAEAAELYARAIRAHGVNTEARGRCYAACAYAFLAGKEHRFGRGPQANGLLLPVPARPGAGELIPVSVAPGDVWQADRGVLFTSHPTLFGRVYRTFYCDGSQGSDWSKCEPLGDADPYKLGVLTP